MIRHLIRIALLAAFVASPHACRARADAFGDAYEELRSEQHPPSHDRRCELVRVLQHATPPRAPIDVETYVNDRTIVIPVEIECTGSRDLERSVRALLAFVVQNRGHGVDMFHETQIAVTLGRLGVLPLARSVAEEVREHVLAAVLQDPDSPNEMLLLELEATLAGLDIEGGAEGNAEARLRSVFERTGRPLEQPHLAVGRVQLVTQSAIVLSTFLVARGRADESETLLRTAIDRACGLLGAPRSTNDPGVAALRLALSRTLRATGDREGARSQIARAAFAQESVEAYQEMAAQLVAQGWTAPGTALADDLLAHMLPWHGCAPRSLEVVADAAQAEDRIEDELSLRRRAAGLETQCGSLLDYATQAMRLADLELRIGSEHRARSTLDELRDRYAGGRSIPLPVSMGLSRLDGLVAARANRVDVALADFASALRDYEHTIAAVSATATVERTDEYVRIGNVLEHDIVRLAMEHPTDRAAVELALHALLLVHGRGLDVSASTHRDDPTAGDASAARLRTLRGRLAALALNPPDHLAEEARRASMAEIRAELRALEERTGSRVFTSYESALSTDLVPAIASRLGSTEAFVHFVRVGRSDASTEADYVAIVVRAPDSVRLVRLGAASVVERNIAESLRGLSTPPSASATSVPLFASIFDADGVRALDESLAHVSTRHVVADAALELVPFDALRSGDGAWIEAGPTVFVPSLRTFLDVSPNPTPDGPIVVFADPAFGSSEGSVAIPPLPGTRTEAEAIASLVPGARVLLGRDATESAFLAAENPVVLHVATHGVYVPPNRGDGDESRGDVASRAIVGARFRQVDEPFVRSVLLFAGAADTASPSRSDDGIVTALEILGMRLGRTELVVLSACETGRGDLVSGAGLYGVRRAMLFAGARSVVTSLWKVDDEATATFMRALYGALRDGRTRADAMRIAALATRETWPHPYYWAAFSLAGRSGPLRLSP